MEPIQQTDLEQQRKDTWNAVRGSMTEEDIDSVLGNIEDPNKKEGNRATEILQRTKELQEFISSERKNEQLVKELMPKLVLELIKIHPKQGEAIPPENYLAIFAKHQKEIVERCREAYKNSPEVNPQSVAFVIYTNALGELHGSDSFNTARELFLTQQERTADTEESIPNSEISSPLSSETIFSSQPEHLSTQAPSMFRLEDLQKQAPTKKERN